MGVQEFRVWTIFLQAKWKGFNPVGDNIGRLHRGKSREGLSSFQGFCTWMPNP